MSNTDLYLRLGVNTQAWREFCRAEQLLAQRDALLAALRTIAGFSGGMSDERRAEHMREIARVAIANATKE